MRNLPLTRLASVAPLALVLACHASPDAPTTAPPQRPSAALIARTPAAVSTQAPATLDIDTETRLGHWFNAVGPVRRGEKFGALIVRSARTQLGMPYLDEPSPLGPEVLTCRLDTFECVTFVESTLAVSRCIWQKQANAACFARTLTTLRYRGGRIEGYPSRLHYFEDWLADNASRGLMTLITAQLGGKPVEQPTAFMTDHPELFPALTDPQTRSAIAATEARVSLLHPAVIERSELRKAELQLQDGDVVAVAITKPDILVSHTGFVSHDKDGTVRLLHASSFRHRVVFSEQDLAQYILRRPERRGVLVARPLPPP